MKAARTELINIGVPIDDGDRELLLRFSAMTEHVVIGLTSRWSTLSMTFTLSPREAREAHEALGRCLVTLHQQNQ